MQKRKAQSSWEDRTAQSACACSHLVPTLSNRLLLCPKTSLSCVIACCYYACSVANTKPPGNRMPRHQINSCSGELRNAHSLRFRFSLVPARPWRSSALCLHLLVVLFLSLFPLRPLSIWVTSNNTWLDASNSKTNAGSASIDSSWQTLLSALLCTAAKHCMRKYSNALMCLCELATWAHCHHHSTL